MQAREEPPNADRTAPTEKVIGIPKAATGIPARAGPQ